MEADLRPEAMTTTPSNGNSLLETYPLTFSLSSWLRLRVQQRWAEMDAEMHYSYDVTAAVIPANSKCDTKSGGNPELHALTR